MYIPSALYGTARSVKPGNKCGLGGKVERLTLPRPRRWRLLVPAGGRLVPAGGLQVCDCYLIDSCCHRGGGVVCCCGGGGATGRGCGCYRRGGGGAAAGVGGAAATTGGGAAAATGAVGQLLLRERLLPVGVRWLLLGGELQPARGRLLLRGWALPGLAADAGGSGCYRGSGGGCYRGGGSGYRGGGAGCCCEGATAFGS